MAFQWEEPGKLGNNFEFLTKLKWGYGQVILLIAYAPMDWRTVLYGCLIKFVCVIRQ